MIEPSSWPAACQSASDLPEKSKGSPVSLPVAVVAGDGFCPVPVAGKERAGVPVDDVVLEGEGEVFFHPRGLELLLLAEGEDVVADDVLPAVVLVEAAGLDAVDEVVLEEDVGAAFVGIEAPAAVAVGVDVVEDVVDDLRAFRRAEGVDAAHVAEHAPADVVDVVEGDAVPLGQAFAVSPAPADGDARVVEVGDFVVGDGVVGAVSDPDADGAGEDPPAAADDVVVDGDVAGVFRLCGGDGRLADADTADAQMHRVQRCWSCGQIAGLHFLCWPHCV